MDKDIDIYLMRLGKAIREADDAEVKGNIFNLASVFLKDVNRIADSLETLAECVNKGNGGAYPQIRTSR